jgi:hypothetical protein
MVALDDSLVPLLSVQLSSIFSPAAPPVNLNDRNGFFDMVGPHSVVSSGSPW